MGEGKAVEVKPAAITPPGLPRWRTDRGTYHVRVLHRHRLLPFPTIERSYQSEAPELHATTSTAVE